MAELFEGARYERISKCRILGAEYFMLISIYVVLRREVGSIALKYRNTVFLLMAAANQIHIYIGVPKKTSR